MGTAGGSCEPSVQGAISWRLDKNINIEVRFLKYGPWTVRLVFQGWPCDFRLLGTQRALV